MQLVVGDSFSAAVLLEGYSVLFLMVVIFKIYQQQRLYSPKIGSSIWLCIGLLLGWRMAGGAVIGMMLSRWSPFTRVLIFFGFCVSNSYGNTFLDLSIAERSAGKSCHCLSVGGFADFNSFCSFLLYWSNPVAIFLLCGWRCYGCLGAITLIYFHI